MRLEPGEVASLVTATGDQQLVVLASGDAAQFHLTRRSLFARACGGKRETDVAFDRGDNFADRLSHRSRVKTRNVSREVFCLIQDGEQRKPCVVYSQLARQRSILFRHLEFAQGEFFLNERVGKKDERPQQRRARRMQ